MVAKVLVSYHYLYMFISLWSENAPKKPAMNRIEKSEDVKFDCASLNKHSMLP